MATIVVAPPPEERPKGRKLTADQEAAQVLADWIRKMTDAELTIAQEAPQGKPAIYVGKAALAAGLKLAAVKSTSGEGLLIESDGQRVLLAGQDDTSTVKAACRLLEELGCRYLIDHPLGEVYPRVKTLSLGKLRISEQPGFQMRRIWGSSWSGDTLWKTWNGAGGAQLHCGHAWGSYIDKDVFEKHPEFFALRGGKRQPGDWYCTSNPQLRERFAQAVIERIEAGNPYVSISPPDGRGYCECDVCRKQDDPQSIEPSSGTVCVTNRYCDFYQYVASRVRKAHPEAILSFYCYADYTQAPTSGIRLEPNLCAWLAPIRYCRYHRIGDPACPSRKQLAEMVDDWTKPARKIAYRTYNYNLAELLVPYSKISIWKHDIPYLKEKGCIGINNETLTNWQLYAPHIYLSLRLAYDPSADADAILDDFYSHFYGPKATSPMKQYWTSVDRAIIDLDCHSGSFYALHRIYTPQLLADLRQQLNLAAEAAKSDEKHAARVQMAAEGWRNAREYMELRGAIHRGQLTRAKQIYDRLLARSEQHQQSGLGNHYTVGYLKRFLGGIANAGAEAAALPNRVMTVLPDRWKLAYDENDEGVVQGWYRPGFDDSGWSEVATYSDTLDAQGLPDRQTVMWYRTRFEVPEPADTMSLLLLEIDGDATVYVNGKQVGEEGYKRRSPFEVDVSRAIVEGSNLVVVRADHSKMTELFLGGIIRPIVLIEKR